MPGASFRYVVGRPLLVYSLGYSGFHAFLLRRMLRGMCIVGTYMLTLEGKGRPFEWNIWLPWSVLLIAVSYEEDLYIARSLHAPYPQFV